VVRRLLKGIKSGRRMAGDHGGRAFAVVAGVFTASPTAARAHLNPAVTLGFAVMTSDFNKVVGRLAQPSGRSLASRWDPLRPHWSRTADPNLKLGVFCRFGRTATSPRPWRARSSGTFVPVLLWPPSQKISRHRSGGRARTVSGWEPVWGIGHHGGFAGLAINPRAIWGRGSRHPAADSWQTRRGLGLRWARVIGPLVGGRLPAAGETRGLQRSLAGAIN
jgi:glycerol uptake facilitator protein